MRKIAIIILSFLILSLPRARAQDDDFEIGLGAGGGFTFGIKGGLVSSSFAQQFQKLETAESRTGFSVGLYGSYQITDLIGVSLEALYVQEGIMRLDPNYIYYYQEGTNEDGSNYIWAEGSSLSIRRVNSNVTLHNFEFPVLVNFTLPEMGSIQPKVFIGGSFDYIYRAYAMNLLSVISYYTNPSSAYVLSDRYFDNVTSSFTYYNISGIIGIGVEYEAFTFDVRYKFGFVPINNLASFNLQNRYLDDFTSNALMISIGVNLKQILNL